MLIKFLNLLFYSNAWIALAAACSVWQTLLFISEAPFSDNLPILVFTFTSTLFIYALHRIEGLKKVKNFQGKGRYLVISSFKSHITIYAILGGLSSFVSFLFLNWNTQIALLLPAILSLGYVLPALNKKRRLRDLHFIKIFLIAIVWTWVGVLLPVLEVGFPIDERVIWLLLERFCFIFAITLPFDIRDLEIDRHTKVKTIPALLGAKKSKLLALASLGLLLLCCWMNVWEELYRVHHFLLFALHAFFTAIIIYFTHKDRHDYYFTGILDGTIIFQFLLLGLSKL
ncbi:MAG: UbiA family prenyltransferase [Bacteroidota bacterium]